jgi:hypothetical protein
MTWEAASAALRNAKILSTPAATLLKIAAGPARTRGIVFDLIKLLSRIEPTLSNSATKVPRSFLVKAGRSCLIIAS